MASPMPQRRNCSMHSLGQHGGSVTAPAYQVSTPSAPPIRQNLSVGTIPTVNIPPKGQVCDEAATTRVMPPNLHPSTLSLHTGPQTQTRQRSTGGSSCPL